MTTTSLGVVEFVSLVDTPGFLTGGSQASSFTMLMDGIADPVVPSISSDSLVLRINQYNFEVLVSRVLVDPVGVQDSQVSSTTANSFFSGSSQGSLVFQFIDT